MYSNYPQYAVAYPQYFGNVIPPKPPEPDPGDAFIYEEDASGNLIITGLSDYGKTIENIVIPASYNGKKITEIKQKAFYGVQTIKTVHFKEKSNILIIGTDAFNGASIENFDLPDSEVRIGSRAFLHCNCDTLTIHKNLKSVSISQVFDSVKNVIFEEGSTRVPAYIMYGNKALLSFTIPDTVTLIAEHAFDKTNMKLNTLTLPSNIKTLGAAAFQTVEIDYLTIPKSLQGVSDTVVFGSVKHVSFEEGMKTIPSSVMLESSASHSLIWSQIPESVTVIGNKSFGNCSSYTDTYFMGNAEQWANVKIGTGNDYLKNAAVHFGIVPGVDD